MSLILFLTGLSLIVFSKAIITGAFLGFQLNYTQNLILGFILMIFSITIFLAGMPLENMVIDHTDTFKDLAKLSGRSLKNEQVKREIPRLIEQLKHGNFQGGIGFSHLPQTKDIFYLRGKMGGRVFYHRLSEHKYELIAYANKNNEQKVINI